MFISVKLPIAVGLIAAVGLAACGQGASATAAGARAESLSARRGDAAARDGDDDRRPRQHRHQRRDRWHDAAGEPGVAGHGDGSAAGSGGAAAPDTSAGGGGEAAPPPGSGAAGQAGTTPSGGTGGSSATAGRAAEGGAGSQPSNAARYLPKPGASWQIQLTGELDSSVAAELFDIDLFETSNATISAFHAAGKRVICYFDTAYEPGRPDSAALAAYRGNAIDGWPGQSWVDFRQAAVVDVMLSRLQLASDKGCDGVDADDVDARDNDPGFPISAADQQSFVITLADAAHAHGLAFGLKNALDDVPALVQHVDFAVNEECFDYDECDALQPFVQAGKAVFQIEYTESNSLQARASEICPRATALGLDTLIKDLDLDAARYSCR